MTAVSSTNSARSVTKEDLEAILDSLVEGIVTLDDEGRIIGINRAACRILEVEKDEALNACCCDLMGRQLCDSAAAVRDSIRNHRPVSDVRVQVRTRSAQKKVLVFQTNLLRNTQGRRGGSVVVLRDVTELENAIEYAFVKGRAGLLGANHLPPELRAMASAGAQPHDASNATERSEAHSGQTRLPPPAADAEAVRSMLEATGWNVAKAARRLRISRTTLYKRLAGLGIRRPAD